MMNRCREVKRNQKYFENNCEYGCMITMLEMALALTGLKLMLTRLLSQFGLHLTAFSFYVPDISREVPHGATICDAIHDRFPA